MALVKSVQSVDVIRHKTTRVVHTYQSSERCQGRSAIFTVIDDPEPSFETRVKLHANMNKRKYVESRWI